MHYGKICNSWTGQCQQQVKIKKIKLYMLYRISLIIFIRKLERGGQRESSSVYCHSDVFFYLHAGTCLLEIGVREREREKERGMYTFICILIHFHGRALKKQSSSSGGKGNENSEWSSTKERLCNCHREAYR